MGNSKQINIAPIPTTSFASLEEGGNQSSQAGEKEEASPPKRIAIDAHYELAELLKDYSYYSGMTQKEVIVYILEEYFKRNKPKQRPQEVRERADKRIDRRRKKYKI